jgi:hypothetical protein
MDLMKAFDEPYKLQLATNQVRRSRQPLQIIGFQWSRFIRAEKSVIGVMPRMTCERFAALAKLVGHFVRYVGWLVHRSSPTLERFACS